MSPPIVKRFLISLNENIFVPFFVFIIIVGGSMTFAFQPPPNPSKPRYEATGTISFENPPPAFTSTGQQIQLQGRSINLNLLLGARSLERIAQKLQWSANTIKRALDKNLTIRVPEEGQAQLITLEYTERNPEEARRILRIFMEEMVEESRLINTSQLRERIRALESRLDEVKANLAIAEATYYQYISEEGGDLLAVQGGSVFTGISSSQQQQRILSQALAGVDAEISSLEEQLGLSPDQAYTASILSADPIMANLRALIIQAETQLYSLEQDLRPEHPNIVALRKQLETNEELLQNRASELIGDDGILKPLPDQTSQKNNLDQARQELANRLVILNNQKQSIEAQLNSAQNTEQQLRLQYELFPTKQFQEARLIQEVESQRILYQTILAALVDAQSAEAETVGGLTIAQEPFVPPLQISPPETVNPLLIIGGGVALGFIASMGVVFLLATLDNRLHTPEEIQEIFVEKELAVIGQLPFVISLSPITGQQIPLVMERNSPYMGFYERFRSNLRRFSPESTKVILITSAVGEEGKTVTAYNLAIACANAGKRTLLLEADLRSPSQSQYFQITMDSEAKLEPLRYYGARSESIQLVPEIQNLYILPSPGPQQQAAAIVESGEMERLIQDSRGQFDMVIVDTPSLSKSNDALLLESLADGIVLVTRPGITPKSILNDTLDDFIEADLNLIGAVINKIDNLASPPDLVTPALESESEELISPSYN